MAWRKYMGACCPVDREAEMVARGNDSFFAAVAQKTQYGFDLRSHVSRRKMAGLVVAFQFGGFDVLQRPL